MKALSAKMYLWLWRGLIGLVLLGLVVFGSAVLALRYWVLPDIGQYRQDIAAALSRASGQRIAIASIAADWSGLRPHLSLGGVVVFDQKGRPALSFDRVEAVLSWKTALVGEMRLHRLEIKRPRLGLRREPDGLIYISDIALNQPGAQSGFADWLMRQEEIVISHGEVEWQDNLRQAPVLTLDDVGFRLDNGFAGRHRFGLVATPPAALASRLDIRGDLRGRSLQELVTWRGTLYARLDYTDIAAWRPWVQFPYRLTQGTGGMQGWLELAEGKPVGVTADVHLSGVKTRLAKTLPELDLRGLSGRLGWHQVERGFQAEAKGLAVDGPEISFPAASFFLKYQAADARHAESGQLRAEGIALEPLMRLSAHLPLSPAQRQVLSDVEPRGQFKQANLSWDGPLDAPTRYAAKASFANLGMKPYGKLPGFSNVSGTLDLDSGGGSVVLRGRYSMFDMPQVFRYPVGFDSLDAAANWRVRGGRLELALTKASFANADVAGAVSGSYESTGEGPGRVDLTGSLSRGNARAIYLYLPRVIGEHTHDWLRDALASGTASDVKLRLKGDLRHFPFPDDQDGVFRVTLHGQDATIDYAPGWPPIENVAATLEFRGKRMEIAASQGVVSNVRLPRVKAVIPDLLAPEEVLQIEGEAQGATADVLRYVNASPVAEWIGHLTQQAEAQGAGRLALRLTLPLRKLGTTRVNGSYQFYNNSLRLQPDTPQLQQVNGRLDFTENGVSAPRITGNVLGGPASMAIATLADHSVRLTAAGRLTAQGLRDTWPHPVTQALHGATNWSLGVGLRNQLANLSFASDLRGLESTLPAPFAKAAGDSLPLRIDRRMTDAQNDSVSLQLGKVVTAELARRFDAGGTRVRQGTVRFGSVAPAPAHEGVWVDGELPYLDLDAWRALLASGDGGPPELPLSGVHLKADALDFLGRRFNRLQLNAWTQGPLWQATVDGDEVAGEASWRSIDGGRIAAHFKRLVVPEAAPERGVAPGGGRDLDLPALDVVVDDLVLHRLKLGRLEIAATKQASDWRIDRLRVTNPDAAFNATGVWQSWLAQPTTKLDADLEVKDVGKFLGRMGYPDRIRRGTAKLTGNLSWRGGPAAFNLATLSGNLRLEAHSGQFLKIEPGIGKLLGLLSLQSLPRRLTLDFRDVFSEGFAFDNIAGSTVLNNGMLATNDFVMQGPAAVVTMTGATDLAKETQNLRVKVVPGVGEGVAVAGAFLGGPIVGVTALLLQKLLKDPVGQMISYEYQVTGTWDNPQVVKLGQPAAQAEGAAP
jgi:uncharacterized protein (TIGR02099 family)